MYFCGKSSAKKMNFFFFNPTFLRVRLVRVSLLYACCFASYYAYFMPAVCSCCRLDGANESFGLS